MGKMNEASTQCKEMKNMKQDRVCVCVCVCMCVRVC
jgi:hypothetical protein